MYNPADQETATVWEERIDAAIAAGIRRGQAEQARRRVRIRRRIGGAAAACVLLFACFQTIRVSPVFAALVHDIPGFGKFVDLIRDTQDRGIQLAIDNDFVQPVGVSDEHDGMKFTVQGIIVDDTRMVLFYDVQLPKRDEFAMFENPELTDASGKSLPVSIGYQYSDEAKQDVRKTGVQRGTADFNLVQGSTFPDEVILKAKLERTRLPDPSAPPDQRVRSEKTAGVDAQKSNGTEILVKFRIDRARFAGLRHEYALNQTVNVEGQKVTFAKAVVSPLKVSLYLDYDAANGKQVFDPGDIRLVDDEGTVWKNFSGSLAKDHPVFHFESPYFNEPESLFVEGSWFRALDKDKTKVTVDTERRKLVQSPDDKLTLQGVTGGSEQTKLEFALGGIGSEDHMLYSLFEQDFTDAGGRTYTLGNFQGVSTSLDNAHPDRQYSYYHLNKNDYKQPLTFTISNYPQYIREPYRIRIK